VSWQNRAVRGGATGRLLRAEPRRPETESQLLAQARAIHPERDFPPDFPSSFRKK